MSSRSLGGASLLAMARHDVSDKRLVLLQGSAHLRREGGVLAGLSDARELVEASADAGEFAQQGSRGRVGPGPRLGAERGLADEAGRGEARAPSALSDLVELLGVEANQLRGGPAVDHGSRGMGGKRDDATLFADKSFPLRRTVLTRSSRGTSSYFPVPRNSADRSGVLFTRCPPLHTSSPGWGPACQRRRHARLPYFGTPGFGPASHRGGPTHTPP